MTEQRLAEIEARANAATPGPWTLEWNWSPVNADEKYVGCGCGPDVRASVFNEMVEKACSDGRFIAHAREDVPTLCAEVRRLHAALEQTAEALVWASGASDFAPDGKARTGWMNLAQPALDAAAKLIGASAVLLPGAAQ